MVGENELLANDMDTDRLGRVPFHFLLIGGLRFRLGFCYLAQCVLLSGKRLKQQTLQQTHRNEDLWLYAPKRSFLIKMLHHPSECQRRRA